MTNRPVAVYTEYLQIFLSIIARVGVNVLKMILLADSQAFGAVGTSGSFDEALGSRHLHLAQAPANRLLGVIAKQRFDVVGGVAKELIAVLAAGADFAADGLELLFDNEGHAPPTYGPGPTARFLLTHTLSK